jgi:hypothetical protein
MGQAEAKCQPMCSPAAQTIWFAAFLEAAGVEFVDENGSGPGVPS